MQLKENVCLIKKNVEALDIFENSNTVDMFERKNHWNQIFPNLT